MSDHEHEVPKGGVYEFDVGVGDLSMRFTSYMAATRKKLLRLERIEEAAKNTLEAARVYLVLDNADPIVKGERLRTLALTIDSLEEALMEHALS